MLSGPYWAINKSTRGSVYIHFTNKHHLMYINIGKKIRCVTVPVYVLCNLTQLLSRDA